MNPVKTAIVLTGGFATRLRPLTLTKPKPLLPILDKPLLDWILADLKNAGIKQVILSVRYLADMIRSRYENGDDLGIDISYSEEVRPLGDAGPIPKIIKEFEIREPFLVVYGDVFSNIDYKSICEYHRKKGGLATLALTKVDDPSRYGVAVLDNGNRIVDFIEKPPKEKVKSNLINAGVYVFEPEAVKYFPAKTPSKLSREVIPKMVQDRVIYGYIHEGMWSDIGVPADYLWANIQALRHCIPEGYVSDDAEIEEDVELIQPVFIGKNVKVKKGTVIGPNAIIGQHSILGPSTRVLNSLLMDKVITEGASFIEDSIVGDRTYIGKWVRISAGSVLGDEVVIKDGVFIAKRTVILPYKEVSRSIEKEGQVIL